MKGPSAASARVTQVTRAKLMVLLPLTMALLVGGTGFYTVNMTERIYVLHGTARSAVEPLLGRLGIQIALVSVVAALLGLSVAVGVTMPLREVTHKLEALASGDLRATLDIRAVSELDSLGGAFNDAIGALNRYIFQMMTGAVITLNADGVVIGSSPATEAILGHREDELVGLRFSEVFTPATGGRAALAAVEAAIARREPVALDDAPIVAKDGRPIRIGIRVSYLRRGDRRAGQPSLIDLDEAVGVTIAFKDLSEIRRLRDRLQQADQLVALGTLTAGVAHELRNPLASLQGLAELLGRDFLESDPRQRYLKTMLDAIGRLNHLVEDLLVFSSPAPPVIEEVDVNGVVRDTVSFVTLGLGGRRVSLALENESRKAIVAGSRDRLGQALSNILLNAVQATSDGGVVTVCSSRTDSHAQIQVHNTGSYIPPDRMRRLFTPFFTTKPQGTGLGLAIARQIVTAQGGRVEVESDPASGTTFTIELPLASREAPAITT